MDSLSRDPRPIWLLSNVIDIFFKVITLWFCPSSISLLPKKSQNDCWSWVSIFVNLHQLLCLLPVIYSPFIIILVTKFVSVRIIANKRRCYINLVKTWAWVSKIYDTAPLEVNKSDILNSFMPWKNRHTILSNHAPAFNRTRWLAKATWHV